MKKLIMKRLRTVLIVTALTVSTLVASSAQQSPNLLQSRQKFPIAVQDSIKVTVATVEPLLGPPTSRHRTGEQIPVTITLTNTSNLPVYVCLSSDLYQDIPGLPGTASCCHSALGSRWTSKTCKGIKLVARDLPEPMMLRPNQLAIVDWLVLVDSKSQPTGARYWYDTSLRADMNCRFNAVLMLRWTHDSVQYDQF
jgi:hypothetical protein